MPSALAKYVCRVALGSLGRIGMRYMYVCYETETLTNWSLLKSLLARLSFHKFSINYYKWRLDTGVLDIPYPMHIGELGWNAPMGLAGRHGIETLYLICMAVRLR